MPSPPTPLPEYRERGKGLGTPNTSFIRPKTPIRWNWNDFPRLPKLLLPPGLTSSTLHTSERIDARDVIAIAGPLPRRPFSEGSCIGQPRRRAQISLLSVVMGVSSTIPGGSKMYSVVVLMALSTGGEAVEARGGRGCGSSSCCYSSCCYSYCAPYSCGYYCAPVSYYSCGVPYYGCGPVIMTAPERKRKRRKRRRRRKPLPRRQLSSTFPPRPR